MQNHPSINDAPPPRDRKRQLRIAALVFVVLAVMLTVHLSGVLRPGH